MAARSLPFETVWDLYAAAPEQLRAEVMNGTLHVEPRPAGEHAWGATQLAFELGGPFQRGRGGPGGWIFLVEPELRLGGDALSPDLAGWRKERLPTVRVASFTIAPDWVCEVLSPSTRRRDEEEKMSVYAREAIPFVWLVDPLARNVRAFRLEGGSFVPAGEASREGRLAPFEEAALDFSALWPE